MMNMKRVCLEPTDPENYDADYNITIDLILLHDGVPSNKLPALGIMGGFADGSERSPFVLYSNGNGDFGSEWDEDERDFHFNLRGSGRSVVCGEYFTLKHFDDVVTYRVTQVLEMT